MRSFKNGRRFDTNTGRLIGEVWNGFPKHDSDYIAERLMQNAAGIFFLHGVGGGDTRYAKIVDGVGMLGEKIIPLSVEAANKWMESHLSPEEFQNAMNPIGEGSFLYLRISPKIKKALETHKARTGESYTKQVINLIREREEGHEND